MSDKTRTALPLATVLAGALAVLAVPAGAQQQAMEKCYGVAKAGENGCAHAKGLHSCAGNSNLTYDGGDWKLVPAGACAGMDGSLTPYEGMNPKKKA